MKKLKLLLSFIIFLGIISGCTKQYTINDIVNQKGIYITRIEERTLDISFNKVDIPANNSEIKKFKKDEVLAFQTESSHVYLESIQYNETEPEYLIFSFNMSYVLENTGYVTVPYKPHLNDNKTDYTYSAKLKFDFIDDGIELYEDAIYMHGNGSDEKFAVNIRKDVYEKANNIISFTMKGFYDLTYVEE